jgi:hypothetical protein
MNVKLSVAGHQVRVLALATDQNSGDLVQPEQHKDERCARAGC